MNLHVVEMVLAQLLYCIISIKSAYDNRKNCQLLLELRRPYNFYLFTQNLKAPNKNVVSA